MTRLVTIAITLILGVPAAGADPKDWPTYNGDAAGWRFSAGETALDRATVGKLEEKWRFPAKDSDLNIGAVHATPAVVDGHVYFGTVTQPTFYALAPDGKQLNAFVKVEDPDTFNEPLYMTNRWRKVDNPLLETVCSENNQDHFNQGLFPLPRAQKPDF